MHSSTSERSNLQDGGGSTSKEGQNSPKPRVFPDLFASAHDASLSWQPFRQGIDICRLYEQPGGASSAFLRYAPGARLARHQHGGYEHILVLSGSQTDDNGEHCVGAMVIHPPGSSHTVTTLTGCVVLAYWEKPVSFLPDEPPDRL